MVLKDVEASLTVDVVVLVCSRDTPFCMRLVVIVPAVVKAKPTVGLMT